MSYSVNIGTTTYSLAVTVNDVVLQTTFGATITQVATASITDASAGGRSILTGLDTTTGMVEQDSASTFVKNAIGSVGRLGLAAIGETEGADVINLEPRRVDITTGTVPYIMDARDSLPTVHMISLSSGSVQIDVSGLDLYKAYYFANISQIRNAPATLDCGAARNFQGNLTDPATTNKRTFDLQPGMSVVLRRIGGSIIDVAYSASDWIGTTDFKVRLQPDGTYEVRYRYNASGATPIAAGAAATATTSTYLDLSAAIVVSCEAGTKSDGSAQGTPKPYVIKQGTVGGLQAHQFAIMNPSASSITAPVTVVFANVTRV